MTITRVTVFDAESPEGYDQAIKIGLSRARRMVSDSGVSIDDVTVTEKQHQVDKDGSTLFRVALDVSFGYKP